MHFKILTSHNKIIPFNSLFFPFVLFGILHASDLFHFKQINRRYWVNHSDAFYGRLFYPVPFYVIMTMFLINKAAEISPPKVWFLPHAQVCGKPQPHMTMITISTDFCNPISQDSYENLINSLQFHQLTCTCGHSACLTIHGYYDRNIKLEDHSVLLHICRPPLASADFVF